MIVRPPALATWLLNHLISGPNSESLVGDLVERYQEKRSALWFWRQTVIAIIASFAVQLWRHRWIAAVVVAIDLLLPEAYMRLVFHWVAVIDSAWYPRLIRALARNAPDAVWSTVIFLRPWFWTGNVAWCALHASIAWILVRAACPRERGLTLTVFVLASISQCVPHLQSGLRDWLHDVANPITMFGFLWYATFSLVAIPSSILAGGGFFSAPRVSRQRPRT